VSNVIRPYGVDLMGNTVPIFLAGKTWEHLQKLNALKTLF